MVEIILVLSLLVIGFFAGRLADRRHLAGLDRREAEHADVLGTTLRQFPGGADPGLTPLLVVAEVAISTDYFKTFIAGIKKFFGGELRTYESLMRRARREVTVKLLEQARARGYDAVCCIRIEGLDVGGSTEGGNKGVVSVAMIASGTAYKRAAA